MGDARHAREEHYVANVPADAYYKEQINTLQRKLEDLQTRNEMLEKYNDELEQYRASSIKRIKKLERAIIRLSLEESDV